MGALICGFVVNLSPSPLEILSDTLGTMEKLVFPFTLGDTVLRTVQTAWLAPGEGIRAYSGPRPQGGRHRLTAQPARLEASGALGGMTGEQRLTGRQG